MAGKCQICQCKIEGRSDRKFCSDLCKQRYHGRHALKRCASCDLPHGSVKEKGWQCVHCLYFDLVAIQKAALAEAVAWARDRSLCAYCGEPAGEIEHVFPKCSRLPTFTVLACGECNKMAGGELFQSFIEKRDYIRDRRAKRYRKLLKMPSWDDAEIDELRGRLRSYVKCAQIAKEIVEGQLRWDLLQAEGTL